MVIYSKMLYKKFSLVNKRYFDMHIIISFGVGFAAPFALVGWIVKDFSLFMAGFIIMLVGVIIGCRSYNKQWGIK